MHLFLRKFFGQIFKGTVSQNFSLQGFFGIHLPPSLWKFAEIFTSQGAPPVSTTPVANLPLVSMTAAVNFVTGTAGVIDTGSNWCQWTAYTFQWFWRKKFFCYVNSLPIDVQTKQFKLFLPTLSMTPVVHLELLISPWIFKKIQNDPNWIFMGLGKLIHEKNLNSKISWHCPFKEEWMFFPPPRILASY